MTAGALARFRQAAAGAMSEGLQQSLEQVRYHMRHATQDVRGAAGELENRIRTAGRLLAAHAWKSFVASATASLAVLGVAAWVGWHTHQEIVRQEWIGMINAAVDHGRLAPCADEGLCARAGNRWVRIDR